MIDGGAGDDTIDAGGGTDRLIYSSTTAGVTVDLSITSAQNTDGAGTDTISNFEYLTGSSFNDTLTGNTVANNIVGGNGNDVIDGGSGSDVLYGDAGIDILKGGVGTDTMTGGSEADTFVFDLASAFAAIDTIKDFNAGAGDAIDIADLLVGYDPLTDAITNFITFTNSGSHSRMFVDRDGSGAGAYASQQIALIENLLNLNAETLETNGNLITL